MSKPREIWWGYVKAVIREYPRLKAEYNDLYSQSITADNSGMPRSGNASRTTEMVADRVLKGLPKIEQRHYDAVHSTIDQVKKHPTGKERLRLISLVFWHGHTLEHAALIIPCSVPTAKRWHSEFIRQVAENLDLTER